jgi:hypothetical protein
MQQQIHNGLQMICTTIGIFLQVRHSLFRSAMSCNETQGGYSKHYLQSGGHNSETTLQKAYFHTTIFFGANSPSLGLAVHFFLTLYIYQINEELVHKNFCSTINGIIIVHPCIVIVV